MRVLVAGCGAMGLPMATSLLAASVPVVGFDSQMTDQLRNGSVPMLSSVHDAKAEVLLIVVRTAADVFDLCFNKQAVFSDQNPTPPRHVILSSTVARPDVLELRKQLPDSVTLVEAPMSGAPVAAREQRLSFMLAGDSATLDRHQPLFDAMGQTCFRVGDLGCGMLVKTLNNMAAASSVLITRRILADATREGIDSQMLLDVMNASSGGSWFSSQFQSIDWANEGYSTGSTIGILEKDVRCALASLNRAADGYDAALLDALQQLTERTL